MLRRLMFVVAAVAIAACPGPARPVEAFTMQVRLSCDGGCPADVWGPSAGHCGEDLSRENQAGVRTAIGSGEAIVIIDTVLEDGRVARQRTQWTNLQPVRGWFAPWPLLYSLRADGGLAVADAGAGPSFSYTATRFDGGRFEVTEVHELTRSEVVPVQSFDGSDPFVGCCAAVGSGSPPVLGALMFLRRRRSLRG